jgi:hypothetical protein
MRATLNSLGAEPQKGRGSQKAPPDDYWSPREPAIPWRVALQSACGGFHRPMAVWATSPSVSRRPFAGRDVAGRRRGGTFLNRKATYKPQRWPSRFHLPAIRSCPYALENSGVWGRAVSSIPEEPTWPGASVSWAVAYRREANAHCTLNKDIP